MDFLRYSPHLNIDKLKVNKFVFGLNFNIRAKVRISDASEFALMKYVTILSLKKS
jgi:hypothetical protein